MLYLPDVNILIHAKMAGVEEHEVASTWLTTVLEEQNSTILLCETTVLSFLRITTNIRAFRPPLEIDEAQSFIRDLLDHPNIKVFTLSKEHIVDVSDSIKKHNFVGNLVMDAHLAVIALKTGATLVSRDRDFKNIPYLKLLNPFQTKP